MDFADLLLICTSAFVAVFMLLTLLALVMRIIIVLFPQKADETDAAILGALASVMSTLHPGTKITKVEEIK